MTKKSKKLPILPKEAEAARRSFADKVTERMENMELTQMRAAALLNTQYQQVGELKRNRTGGYNLLLNWSDKLGIAVSLVVQLPQQKAEIFELTKAAKQAQLPERIAGNDHSPKALAASKAAA